MNSKLGKLLESENKLVMEYLILRKAIGVMAFAIPAVIPLGAAIFFDNPLQGSISSYYYTGMRDVLVGVLWAIGFFLLAYKGFEPQDDITGDIACVSAIGIAIFPTDKTGSEAFSWVAVLHYVFAAIFFISLIYFSLVLFTKTAPKRKPTPRKLQRNRVYRICGYTMIACLVLIAIYIPIPAEAKSALERFKPVFWLEAVMIWAFGISWLTKGEAILKDE
jgi:hypothetical protein